MLETFKNSMSPDSLGKRPDMEDVRQHHVELSRDTLDHEVPGELAEHLLTYSGIGSEYVNHHLIDCHEKNLDWKTTPVRYDPLGMDTHSVIHGVNAAIDAAPPLRSEGHFYAGVSKDFSKKLLTVKVGDPLQTPALTSTSIYSRICDGFISGTHDHKNEFDSFFQSRPDHRDYQTWKDHFDARERQNKRVADLGGGATEWWNTAHHGSILTYLHFHLPQGFNHGIYAGAEDMDYGHHPYTKYASEREFIIRNGMKWTASGEHYFMRKHANAAFNRVLTLKPQDV